MITQAFTYFYDLAGFRNVNQKSIVDKIHQQVPHGLFFQDQFTVLLEILTFHVWNKIVDLITLGMLFLTWLCCKVLKCAVMEPLFFTLKLYKSKMLGSCPLTLAVAFIPGIRLILFLLRRS